MNRITYQLEGAKAALSADNGSYLLQACSDGIVRCSYSPKEPNPNYSALGISPPQTSKCVWKAAETADTLSLQAGSIQLDIGLSSSHFLWRDAATGKELLQEGNKELTSVPVVKYSTGGEAPKIRRVKTVDGERNFIENLKPTLTGKPIGEKYSFSGGMTSSFTAWARPKRGSIITAAKPSIFTSII